MLDRTEGASILLDSKSNEPIAVTHKQFYWTCGPAALNIVFEHLGLADRNRRTSGLRDLDQEHLDTVDLGYHLSQEHIMYECYHRYRQIDEPGWDADRGKFMNSNGELQTTLASSPDHEGHWYEISYDIGNFTHDSAKRTNSARIENWLKFGAGCGHLNHITDKGLPYVANKYPRWDIPDGYPVSTAIFGVDPTFTSLQHLKAVIKGYIDHSIPLAVGIENGGHYNTIIGYWERNDGFWIYTAEPLDGWGRTCWAKPMRWRKIKINTNVLLGGNDFLVSLFLFGHGTSCYDHGWAQQIDQNPSYVPTLCNYLKFWDGESWGGSDYVPLLDDVDGDGKTDRVLYHQTSGDWGCLISNGGRCQWDGQDWGGSEYIPLLSDVNGDGKADRVLYRESDGDWGCWITDGGRCPWDGQDWGGSEYIPLLGDLNDDGKADRVLYRESDGDWGCRLTNGGKCLWDRHRWGVSNYEPLMGDVNGDGKADRVLYRASDGDWGCWITGGYKCSWDGLKYGDFNYLSLLGDVDGDGKADRVLYRTSDGDWGCRISNGDKCSWDGHDWGGSGYKPYLGNIGGSKADRIIYRPTDGNWGIRIRRNMMLE